MIAAGTVMLVLPGPGLITIAGGLAVLSKDIAWAGRLSDRMKAQFKSAFTKTPEPAEKADR